MTCHWCGKELEPWASMEELRRHVEEHARLFPQSPLEEAKMLCDPCFQRLVPGGQPIGMN